MSIELKQAAKQALKELGEARKIVRASSSRQLAKDWDRRATDALANLREAIQQPENITDEQILDIAAEWSNREFANGAWRFCTDFARAILALRPERVPMTDEEIFNAYCKSDSILSTHITNLVAFAKAIEAHHGIKPKEQP